MLNYSKSFIETQFPVSRISKESYKERKAGSGQTLTGLGKWWGRKPLILVRATLLGALMPVSDNSIKDRDIFLKILTMDDAGLWSRKSKPIPLAVIKEYLNKKELEQYFGEEAVALTSEDKQYIQKLVFNRLSYDEKLVYCDRPEQFNLVDTFIWKEINDHLGTTATNLQELIEQLGIKRFGHRPKVGDAFAGGGSIPFEAARMGADVYASDLNPVATLLNWSALNIAGAADEEVAGLKEFQQRVYDTVDKQITDWGIEHNEQGHRADSYLYCVETVCPDDNCGYRVPLAPSWVIGKKTNTVALLKDNGVDGFDIEVVSNATKEQLKYADDFATVANGKMTCPHCGKTTSISSLRGDGKDANKKNVHGLRMWEKNEFSPRETDVFQERLYAIRYVGEGGRYYKAPTAEDLNREKLVVELLADRFPEWQEKGYLPSMKIEAGYNTTQPIRERGWQYWHQLFNPRQLLVTGLFSKLVNELAVSQKEMAIGLLGVNKIINFNSKLCIWNRPNEQTAQTFSNQALNTLYDYVNIATPKLDVFFNSSVAASNMLGVRATAIIDARKVDSTCDLWLTDPPYADAVNYHELTEFFLAWDKTLIEKAFPEWYTDSKRVLAVKGTGDDFTYSMIDIYKNLSDHMPDNGYQVVMFTHQDVKVWAELTMILWSAGLRVVSAWNVATETESGGLKSGAYVKGTVLLTLQKQTSDALAFQDELYDEINDEVKSIIDSMKGLDDKDDPDFTDADYLLASYAAALKVLTAYKEIDGIDVAYWLGVGRVSGETNPIEALINKASKLAQDYLIPDGFDKFYWKDLTPEERFYLRGVELEINGTHKIAAYQELARGYGVSEYKEMFALFKANEVQIKSPTQYGMRNLGKEGFSATLVRHVLAAIKESREAESTVAGRTYLKTVYKEGNQYWNNKSLIYEILDFLARIEHYGHMEHWHQDSYYAKLLKESLKNEGV